MRLPSWIAGNIELILTAWEDDARQIWPGDVQPYPAELRDDAERILHATVHDMRRASSRAEQEKKSGDIAHTEEIGKGTGSNGASELPGTASGGSGFELLAVIAEYRALRASVLRLWSENVPYPSSKEDLDDVTRFNEAMDQSLAFAVGSVLKGIESSRAGTLAAEQKSREEAEAASRAKDLFLATLSHEIRTPLNAIVGWLTILRGGNCDPADLMEGLAVMERNARVQVQLMEDVLDVSRIASGKLHLDLRPCDLAEAIQSGVEAVRPAAKAREVLLKLQLDPGASDVVCDSVRIQQVVWNLVTNAVKFTPQGGTVGVKLDRSPSNLQITVTDTGQGIEGDLLPHIFERFRQADGSTRRRFSGLGLGLSIVKHIVEAHGGSVQADSAGAGKGSTFTVRLPVRAVRIGHVDDDGPRHSASRAAFAETSARHAGPPVIRLDGLRLLVVEDEPDFRRLLVRTLEATGAIVTPACGAAEALQLLPRIRPEVLISDLAMPDQDGYDLIRAVRRGTGDQPLLAGIRADELPAVALSAFAHQDDARRAMLAGFQVHVPKPVDPHDLAVVIASLAGRAAGKAR
jgi:signal transduction histidine kinase/ActR/RegA family two-component response regulator